MKLQKNQEWDLPVIGMTAEGNGVCKIPLPDGERAVVFVPFTAIGDVIRCRIVKVGKSFCFGKMMKLITPSPDRVTADCPAFGKCGGCAFRHVRYEAELRYKWQRVADAMQRIGHWDGTPNPIVPCPVPDRYRNKVQYPVAWEDGKAVAGFFALHSHRVVVQPDCMLQQPAFAVLVRTVLDWANERMVSVYDETSGQGLLRHIFIRHAEQTDEWMVCLVATADRLPDTDGLTARLRAANPHVASIWLNVNAADTNVVLGDEERLLFGKPALEDVLCGRRVSLSPRAFYQVNHDQAERLYRLAADAADLRGDEVLLDLYCGAGTIGLSMADRVREVIGVESVEPAVQNARHNAAINGIANARFLCGDAAFAAEQLRREQVRPDVVVMDPPRKGCDRALLETVAQMAPRRVVYVSCDPATLARDCAVLTVLGYTVDTVTPVDLFPRTAHVETVVSFSRT